MEQLSLDDNPLFFVTTKQAVIFPDLELGAFSPREVAVDGNSTRVEQVTALRRVEVHY